MMSKKFLIVLSFTAMLLLTACTDTVSVPSSSETPPISSESTQVIGVEFNDRQYNENKVVEVPTFIGTSKEITAMNNYVVTTIAEFNKTVPEDKGYEIYSSPVSSDKYVQVLTQYSYYENDVNVKNLITVNYDVAADDYITLDDVFSNGVHDVGAILTDASAALETMSENVTVIGVEILGFFINETSGEDILEFYIKMDVEGADSEKWTDIFKYTPNTGVLDFIDWQMIIEPQIVDKYDPELIANKIANEIANSVNYGTLIANFTSGNANYEMDDIQSHMFEYQGDLTVELIAQELSELTGLVFAINSATVDGNAAYVDWSMDTTILIPWHDGIAGYNGFEFKDEYLFEDHTALCWFMLDSLNDSIILNLEVPLVYYTMDGGNDLVVPEMPDLAIFSADIPYTSSAFYYAHGTDEKPTSFDLTKGTWRLDGDNSTAYFIMDGTGLVDAYYASGSHEYSAYLEVGYGGLSGFTVFEVYNNNGELINEMWFEYEDSFYWGEPHKNLNFIKD